MLLGDKNLQLLTKSGIVGKDAFGEVELAAN